MGRNWGRLGIGVLNNALFRPLGLRLQRLNAASLEYERERELGLGQDLDRDLNNLIATKTPVVLDVGANVGQSIMTVREFWPDSRVISFEPDPRLTKRLRSNWDGIPGISIVEGAVSDRNSRQALFQFTDPAQNSLFDRDDRSWFQAEVVGSVDVECFTLDSYCSQHSIAHVDLLKVDVQGAELQVIQGASGLLESRLIDYVVLELNFGDSYDGAARPHKIFEVMESHGYVLIATYVASEQIQDTRLQWTNSLWRPR
jgi:FkbM family methyltransferase